MSEKQFLITVPHSKCLGDESVSHHYCDFIAENSAIAIASYLHDSLLITADKNRRDCDLNRKWCRGEGYFRTTITETLRQGNIKVLLDVHSYPHRIPEHDRYHDWTYYEIVILDDRQTAYFADELNEHMKTHGIKTRRAQGIGNDIQDEAHEYGVESTLLEFNERLDRERMYFIASVIASFVIDRQKEKKKITMA